MGGVSPDTSHGDKRPEENQATTVWAKTNENLHYDTYHNEKPPTARKDCKCGRNILRGTGKCGHYNRGGNAGSGKYVLRGAGRSNYILKCFGTRRTHYEEHTKLLLLYKIGEALRAAERTHDSINWKSSKRKSPDQLDSEEKVNRGIASLVQWAQSINQKENMLDFEGAMDWLERESKKSNSLVIDLTKPGKDDTSSNDSSTSSDCDSDGSDYKEGNEDANCDTKRKLVITIKRLWTMATVLTTKMLIQTSYPMSVVI